MDDAQALVGSMVLCLPQAEREPKGSHAKNLEVGHVPLASLHPSPSLPKSVVCHAQLVHTYACRLYACTWRAMYFQCLMDCTFGCEGQSVAAEACMLMWVLVDLNPALLAAFISCNVEQPTLRRSGSPGMWLSILVRNQDPVENFKVLMQMLHGTILQSNVAVAHENHSRQEQLQLSPEQQEALVATRRAMLANVGALLAERDRLATQAQVRFLLQFAPFSCSLWAFGASKKQFLVYCWLRWPLDL